MSAQWMQSIIDWLAGAPGYLALALFFVSLIESLAIAGILVPGVAILFAIAALAGKTGLPLSEALLWAGLGAIAGDTLSFWLGRCFQGRLQYVWPFRRYPSVLEKGEWFFHKYGGASVVIGRFVGPVRPVIPLIAGAFLMPWKKFLTYNIASAIGWAPVYIIPGFLVGSALSSDSKLPPHFYPILAISLAVLVLLYLVAFRLQLGLGNDSRLYARLSRWADRNEVTRQFWHTFTSERPAGAAEFPLPSFALALLCGALFLIWSLIATSTDWLNTFNEQALGLFSGLRSPVIDTPMQVLTLLGDPPVLIGGALATTLVLMFRGYYAAAIHALLAAAATTALVWSLKAGFAIPRPEAVVGPPLSGSYPSGHATGITVFLSLAASFWAREKRRTRRWQIYLVVTLPMVLVCLSRIYLGVHWFSDVIGGLLLGLSICGFIRASYSRYDQIPLRAEAFTVLAFTLWGLFVMYYIYWSWPSIITAYSPV